jgi:hypothetical protein
MTLGEMIEAIEAERRLRGSCYNTVVCRPEHVDTWGQVDPATLRLLFAEHGLKLQIDGASPWSQVSLLWIEPRPTVGAA